MRGYKVDVHYGRNRVIISRVFVGKVGVFQRQKRSRRQDRCLVLSVQCRKIGA